MREMLGVEAPLVLTEMPLLDDLMKVHRQRLKNRKVALPSGYEGQTEIERRYLPDVAEIQKAGGIDEFFKKLLKKPGVYARRIEQVNVSVYANKKRREKDRVTFRLRKTQIIREDDEGAAHHFHGPDEDDLYRIAIKTRVRGIANARYETQRVIKVSDEKELEARRAFLVLEKKAEPDTYVVRTRGYVIDWPLPNGGTCEIHFEMNHGPSKKMTDVFRIEVEFKRPEDEEYVRGDDPAKPLKRGLPLWIGLDVTNDDNMKNKSLAKKGPPKYAARIMEQLKA